MILSSMDALGGRAEWGFQSAANGSSLVDPARLVERLFPNVLALLNETMEKTPVERLRHVQLTAADSQPFSNGRPDQPDWYSERNRLSIRWQLGF
jgi:hypothetical protein